MRIIEVEQNSEEWLAERQGRITGSKLGDLYAAAEPLKADIVAMLKENEIEFKASDTIPVLTKLLSPEMLAQLRARAAVRAPKKIGFYQLIADKLGLDDGVDDGRERGHLFEAEAIDKMTEALGIDPKLVQKSPGMWVREDHDDIAISPDAGVANKKGKFIEAMEAKNKGSARHIEAVITNKLSTAYRLQALQYFIVNEDLKKLHFGFYDPRVAAHPLHIITITREEVQAEVDFYLNYEINLLQEVNTWVEKLVF